MSKRVLISCCNGSGWVRKELMFALVRMFGYEKHEKKLIAPTKKPFVANLHLAVNECLDGGFDYLLDRDWET